MVGASWLSSVSAQRGHDRILGTPYRTAVEYTVVVAPHGFTGIMTVGLGAYRLTAAAVHLTLRCFPIGYNLHRLQDKISKFHPEDFVYPLGGPEPDEVDAAGRQVRVVTLRELPSLERQGLSMVLVNLEACAISYAHTHPRAAEASTVL